MLGHIQQHGQQRTAVEMASQAQTVAAVVGQQSSQPALGLPLHVGETPAVGQGQQRSSAVEMASQAVSPGDATRGAAQTQGAQVDLASLYGEGYLSLSLSASLSLHVHALSVIDAPTAQIM
jgi:hypothetical protein